MRLGAILSFGALATAMACSGSRGSDFGGDSGGGDGNVDNGDAQCGFGCQNYDGGFGDGASQGCDPNPANFDVPGNNCDDDGDGVVDNPQGDCDTTLQFAGPAGDFAKAIGLCKVASGSSWGVVSATYTNGYNSTTAPADPNQHGILPKFGNKIVPRQGGAFGVISSGYATAYDTCNGGAQGVFKGGCKNASGVTLKIKVPANAKGFSFDFDFWSGEWPEDGFARRSTIRSSRGCNRPHSKARAAISTFRTTRTTTPST